MDENVQVIVEAHVSTLVYIYDQCSFANSTRTYSRKADCRLSLPYWMKHMERLVRVEISVVLILMFSDSTLANPRLLLSRYLHGSPRLRFLLILLGCPHIVRPLAPHVATSGDTHTSNCSWTSGEGLWEIMQRSEGSQEQIWVLWNTIGEPEAIWSDEYTPSGSRARRIGRWTGVIIVKLRSRRQII